VLETAVRCLAELKAAHERGVAIRPVELQAAILARRATYSDADTVTTALCTDEDFAAAHTALAKVGLVLAGLLGRIEDKVKRERHRLSTF